MDHHQQAAHHDEDEHHHHLNKFTFPHDTMPADMKYIMEHLEEKEAHHQHSLEHAHAKH